MFGCEDKLPCAGDTICLPQLGRTLETVSRSPKGALELYDGCITTSLIRDLRALGSIITKDDFKNYRAVWREPVEGRLSGGLTVYSSPPPASGHILLLILKVLDGVIGSDPKTNILAIAEAFKYAFALRSGLGDPDHTDNSQILDKINSPAYVNEIKNKINSLKQTNTDPKHYGAWFSIAKDRGTVNIAVLAQNGDAAVATSTINTLFGSLLASESTGIILNNEMDDFSSPQIINSFNLPPCPANYICPNKRPISSSCPTVITDSDGNVRLAVGASGGSHITTSTAQVIMNNLWFNVSIKKAVDMPRIHHQLYPMVLRYEEGISQDILRKAEEVGHKIKKRGPSSSVTAIARANKSITAIYDFRRGGSTSGF